MRTWTKCDAEPKPTPFVSVLIATDCDGVRLTREGYWTGEVWVLLHPFAVGEKCLAWAEMPEYLGEI